MKNQAVFKAFYKKTKNYLNTKYYVLPGSEKESEKYCFSPNQGVFLMKKIKAVIPTLREKKRYVVFEVLSEDNNDINKLNSAITDSFLELYGNIGMAGAGLMFLNEKYKSKLNRGIIKIGHCYVNNLKSALAMIREIDQNKVIIRSISVSGVLRKTAKYLAA